MLDSWAPASMTVADTFGLCTTQCYVFPGMGWEISRARPALPYPARMLQGKSDRHQAASNLATITFLTPGRQVPQASATSAASLKNMGKGRHDVFVCSLCPSSSFYGPLGASVSQTRCPFPATIRGACCGMNARRYSTAAGPPNDSHSSITTLLTPFAASSWSSKARPPSGSTLSELARRLPLMGDAIVNISVPSSSEHQAPSSSNAWYPGRVNFHPSGRRHDRGRIHHPRVRQVGPCTVHFIVSPSLPMHAYRRKALCGTRMNVAINHSLNVVNSRINDIGWPSHIDLGLPFLVVPALTDSSQQRIRDHYRAVSWSSHASRGPMILPCEEVP